MRLFTLLLLILMLLGCESEDTGQLTVDQSINTHFMNGFNPILITFTFRDKDYSVKRNNDVFVYTRSFMDSTNQIKDILINSHSFTRLINGDTANISKEWTTKYTASVNSVLYFFQLPYVLNDPAVIKTYLGNTFIDNHPYDQVKVTFKKADGGEDFTDEYVYWFHQKDKTMDFFAYSYTEDEGGVRFRKAINQRRVNGMLIQDYINYEVAPGTALTDIPAIYETGHLNELSRIINENVVVEYLN